MAFKFNPFKQRVRQSRLHFKQQNLRGARPEGRVGKEELRTSLGIGYKSAYFLRYLAASCT